MQTVIEHTTYTQSLTLTRRHITHTQTHVLTLVRTTYVHRATMTHMHPCASMTTTQSSSRSVMATSMALATRCVCVCVLCQGLRCCLRLCRNVHLINPSLQPSFFPSLQKL
jgi:hypothetical protein